MLLSYLRKERVVKTARYREAAQFRDEFPYANAAAVQHSDLLLDHARRLFDLRETNVRRIDDKADSIIRYFGLVIAALAAFVSFLPADFSQTSIMVLYAAMTCLAVSAIISLLIRIPFDRPLPPTEKDTVGFMRSALSDNAGRMKLALTIGKANAALGVIGTMKARLLKWSHVFLVLGLLGFVVSLGIQSYFRSVSDRSSLSCIQSSSPSVPLPLGCSDSASTGFADSSSSDRGRRGSDDGNIRGDSLHLPNGQ